MTTFALKSLTYQGKVYQSASAEVDEQARRMDLSYVKESFMKKEKVHLAAVYYDERSTVATTDQKVTIGDAQLIMASSDEALHRPPIFRPWRSVMTRSSGTIMPLHIAVGEVRTR